MDDETAIPGPSGLKRRPVKNTTSGKKNVGKGSKPSTTAASGAPEVRKHRQRAVKDKALENKDVKDKALENKDVKDKALENKDAKDKDKENKDVKGKAVKTKILKSEVVKKKDVKGEADKNKDTESAEPHKQKKTTLEMVCDGIKAVGDGRKGASAQAIKKYIQNEKGPETTVKNFLITKAISKGIETGVLSRAKPKAGAIGESRRYILVKKETKEINQKVKKQISDESAIVQNSRKVAGKIVADTFFIGLSDSSTPIDTKRIKASKLRKGAKNLFDTESDFDERKESSDTEIVVKTKRKSTKAYSSDTEIHFPDESKEKLRKKTQASAAKFSKVETQVKPAASKGTVKLNNTEQKTNKQKTNKPKKN